MLCNFLLMLFDVIIAGVLHSVHSALCLRHHNVLPKVWLQRDSWWSECGGNYSLLLDLYNHLRGNKTGWCSHCIVFLLYWCLHYIIFTPILTNTVFTRVSARRFSCLKWGAYSRAAFSWGRRLFESWTRQRIVLSTVILLLLLLFFVLN